MKKNVLLVLFMLFLCGIVQCSGDKDDRVVVSTETVEKELPAVNDEDKDVLRFAVGGMITPKAGYGYYRELLDYLQVKLGRKILYVDRDDYAEINKLLVRSDLDAAFVCGGPYVDGHDNFGIELLVAPRAYGGTVYYSYIIAHKDGGIKKFEDLRGKTFTFTDPLSNTGTLVPTYMLARMGEEPDTFFKSYEYSYAHDKSIKAVATKIVDGAAVDSLIWEYGNKTDPQYTSQTRIIRKSPSYGIPPVVVRPGLEPELKKRLRDLFLTVHNDEQGKKILAGMMTERFVEINDSAYDSIREMKKWLAGRKKIERLK
jgi:phosphonate transport system substrate-binding protein